MRATRTAISSIAAAPSSTKSTMATAAFASRRLVRAMARCSKAEPASTSQVASIRPSVRTRISIRAASSAYPLGHVQHERRLEQARRRERRAVENAVAGEAHLRWVSNATLRHAPFDRKQQPDLGEHNESPNELPAPGVHRALTCEQYAADRRRACRTPP